MTVEDPIEFLHVDKRSVLNQREVGQDTHWLNRALRRVLRQDRSHPHRRTRDEEKVQIALNAAQTGRLSSRRSTPWTPRRRSTA